MSEEILARITADEYMRMKAIQADDDDSDAPTAAKLLFPASRQMNTRVRGC